MTTIPSHLRDTPSRLRQAAASLALTLATVACVVQAAPTRAMAQDSAAATPISGLYAALTRAEAPSAGAPDARAALIGPAIDQAFDLPTILRNSIGLRYASLSESDKARLLQAFRAYTVARYVSNFKPGAGAGFTIKPGTRPSPTGTGVIVDTVISGGSGAPTPVDYLLAPQAAGYRVVDVLLDAHISQVATQRADFSSTLASGGVDALVALMNRKTQSFMNE